MHSQISRQIVYFWKFLRYTFMRIDISHFSLFNYFIDGKDGRYMVRKEETKHLTFFDLKVMIILD